MHTAAELLQQSATTLQTEQVDKLIAYLDLLVLWNKSIRLTGEREPLHIVDRLLLSSLSGMPYVQGSHCADLGSGGGLPGLVLAIALPQTHWTLIDSRLKKTCFLQQAVIELALHNVTVVRSRIEHHRPAQRYHTLTARAIGRLPELLPLLTPLAAPDARLLSWKGSGVASELQQISHMNIAHHSHPIPPVSRRHRLIELTLNATARSSSDP